MQNPLLEKFDLVPFNAIKNEHFLPAIQNAIQNAKEEIDQIVSNQAAPTFKNTLEALEYSGQQLRRVTSVLFNLNSAETNDTIQKITQEVSPLLTDFKNDVSLNLALFDRIKVIHNQKDTLSLSAEQVTLLDKSYKSFSRNGASLPDAQKEKLREIDKELAGLTLKFGENVLADTNAFELLLTDESELDGLPEGSKEAAKMLAETKNKKGWLITLDYPSYIPFMSYATNRGLRKKLALAFGARAFGNKKTDNQTQVLRIAKLRHDRANLLGYQTHAHYVLEERMAESPENVTKFLNELVLKAKPAAEKEFDELQAFAKELDGIEKLEKWDAAFYAKKLKEKLFALDDELLKPYFPLENVINGAFIIARKLFGLVFKETDSIVKYHDDVKTYLVTQEDGTFVSHFYADFHPREGKRGGAWMTSYKSQQRFNGTNERPQVSIVCNFTEPTPTKPSLLTFNEVTTLFHEFGHALHGMLADTTYPSLSGTSVYWDFVELPSQILENWCYEKEALSLFAKHYETGEVIPMELIDKIKASATFHEGLATLRQLSFGLLDLSWHAQDPSAIENVKAQEVAIFKDLSFYPEVSENCMSTAFSHIFQGGYSAGYYSYKWAEVLDADAFEYFKKQGIFNTEIATKFAKNILSRGGTENPMTLYKRFRGQEPQTDALLKRAGLLVAT